jgi:hypothetical protein
MLAVLQAREVAGAHRYLLGDLALRQLLLTAQRTDASTEGVGAFGFRFGATAGHIPGVPGVRSQSLVRFAQVAACLLACTPIQRATREGFLAADAWSTKRKKRLAAALIAASLACLALTSSAGAKPVGLPPLPGKWRLTGMQHALGVAKHFDAKHGSFALSRSGKQRYTISQLHLLLPGTVPKGSPCWRDTPLKVLGTYPAARGRNGEFVLWSVDAAAHFLIDGEAKPGHLDMTFQRGIPGGYYRGENHPVMMEVTIPIGQGLECVYSSAGRPRLTESRARMVR